MGVALAEAEDVVGGITTDVLKRTVQTTQAQQCLSVLCAGRTVDLCLESKAERDAWLLLLKALVDKEKNGALSLSLSLSLPRSPSNPRLDATISSSESGAGDSQQQEEDGEEGRCVSDSLERLLQISALGFRSVSPQQLTALLA